MYKFANRRVGPSLSTLLATAAFVVAAVDARADVLYFTNRNGSGSIQKVDTSTNTITTVTNTPAGLPDSLLFLSGSSIAYTVNTGTPGIVIYNGTTNTTYASGGDARDLTLAPDGKSIYLGEYAQGEILKFDLTTHAYSLFASGLGGVDGLAFGSDGNLYAVVNGRTQVDEFNSSGGIIATRGGFGQLDGMTFDSFTNSIWVGANNAALVKLALGLGSATTYSPANLGTVDGVAADGSGHIYTANFLNSISKYDITGNTASVIASTPGIDDLAPVSGLGAPVPEPGSILLFGTVVACVAGRCRRRLSRS